MNDATKQAVTDVLAAAEDAAEEVVRHRVVRRLAKLGFYTKGFLYVVIGAIAVAAVGGVRDARVLDQRGALAAIALEPYGRLLLTIFVIGASGHGIWNVLRAASDTDNLGRSWFAILTRSINALIGVFYLGLAVAATEIIFSARIDTSASQAEETFAAVLLAIPIVGVAYALIIGLGLIGAGISECYTGLSGRFRDSYKVWRISGLHLSVITVLGAVSFTVRAVLLIVMGYFFIRAPFDGAAGAIGLDAALLALLTTAYGKVAVVVAGLGLVSHGVLAFYEARFRKIC